MGVVPEAGLKAASASGAASSVWQRRRRYQVTMRLRVSKPSRLCASMPRTRTTYRLTGLLDS